MTPERVNRIRECFPDLQILSTDANHDGLVNDVVIVNNELVFRFPKDSLGIQSLDKKQVILKLVRQRVDMPVPVLERPATDLSVYPIIRGHTLQAFAFDLQEETVQDRLARQLADFLRQLHAIPPEELVAQHIPASDAARPQGHWLQMFENVERDVFPFLWTHQKEWVRAQFEPVLDGALSMSHDPVLIHGDLAPYHILWDSRKGRVNGIIDFGTSGVGDPASDFGAIISNYGERLLRRMARYYPAIRKHLDRSRFRAAVIELEWALKGIRSGDYAWFMAHIGSARDSMPLESGEETTWT